MIIYYENPAPAPCSLPCYTDPLLATAYIPDLFSLSTFEEIFEEILLGLRKGQSSIDIMVKMI